MRHSTAEPNCKRTPLHPHPPHLLHTWDGSELPPGSRDSEDGALETAEDAWVQNKTLVNLSIGGVGGGQSVWGGVT